ncbi:hypothetical protein NUW58_g8854 [Xylaria curta]|uniref:Uncharacterized protein n=1 Tax=Xylaria curta TaxID=42375 RepID=A0ACC1N3X4_9PEZI|nr:hypothetical protein NUW58_g8854 [Xylaria curta]
MPPRSGKHHSRYDDPYTFDDPYLHSPPTAQNQPAYEYIGTDEPLSPRFGSPSRHTFSPDHERARRYARTTSPPRHSRHDRAYTPPHTSRHSSSPRPKDRHQDRAHDSKKSPKGKHFYQDFAEKNPKLQQYGKQGMAWLSEAAAAYAAAKAGKDMAKGPSAGPRSRSSIEIAFTTAEKTLRASWRRDRDCDRDRDHEHNRRRRYSTSPPPLSRDPDSYLASRHGSGRDRDRDRDQARDRDRDRDRDHDRGRDRRHRHHRHSPSSSPSPSRRSRARNSTAPPSNPAADRWQMAARAALEAGGLTAFRLRKEPGSWTGGKAAKVATAAIGAAAMDAFMDQDPRGSRGGVKGMAENAITSLIAAQIMGKGTKKRGR